MRQIFPVQAELGDAAAASSAASSAADPAAAHSVVAALAEIYAHPDSGSVRANMVSSVDGAISLDGRSGGLSGSADRLIFKVLRALADVVLVGAGTARAEHYGLARPDWPQLRQGRPASPPIAIVTRQFALDLESPLIRGDADHEKTIILTTDQAPPERVTAAARTARVFAVKGSRVSASDAIGKLTELGYRNILLEGGPSLLSELVAENVLDELCTTVSPLLEGGHAPRMISGGGFTMHLRLASVIEDEGFLLSKYVR